MTRTTTTLFNVSVGFVFLLMLLWQMPGTIALRNMLLVGLLGCSIFLVKRSPHVFVAQLPRMPLLCLGLLTGWMILVIAGWAIEPASSVKEFASQWLIPMLCGFCGIVVAQTAIDRHQSKNLVYVIFLGLLIQVLLHDFIVLWFYWEYSEIPERVSPVLQLGLMLTNLISGSESPGLFESEFFDKFSYLNNLLAAFTIAEIAQRLIARKRFLPLTNFWLLLTVSAILVCSYTIRTRNGNVGLIFLLVTAAIFVALRVGTQIGMLRISLATVVLTVFIAAIGVAFIKSDERWRSLLDTVPIALDTQTHLAWMRQAPYPSLPNGETVHDSNYDRLAWIKEGVLLVRDQPLGSGFSRSAFGDRIVQKYTAATSLEGAHSHSGIVDFAIANGLPGLFLWFAFMAALIWLGWRAYRSGNVASGLMLVFLVTGFLGRSLVDSTLRDHMLQQFMFLALLFSVLARQKQEGM